MVLNVSKEKNNEAIPMFKYLLKTKQEETGISCEQIAKLTGIPYSTVGRMNKHYDYVNKIIDWADERGLNKAEILPMQLEKSREENAELTQAIAKYELGNKDAVVEIKDAIGDIYVTLVVTLKLLKQREIVLHAFRGINLWYSNDELDTDWNCFSELLRTTDTDLFKTFMKKEKIDIEMHRTIILYINLLDAIAKKYNLELVECVDYAYNQIKNRTGKMIDGSFVKDK